MYILSCCCTVGNTNAAMDYYLRKNFYKTASLMGHSCLAAAVLGAFMLTLQYEEEEWVLRHMWYLIIFIS